MTERMRFSFGNIAPGVILSTYPIGLIVPMTGPSHRANLIPSAGRIEGSPRRTSGRSARPEEEEERKKKREVDEAEADLRGGRPEC